MCEKCDASDGMVTVRLGREDATLLLSRTRQMASANEAVAEKYSAMTAAFVDEAARKAEIFGRISAALDNGLEQPVEVHHEGDAEESNGYITHEKPNRLLRKQAD